MRTVAQAHKDQHQSSTAKFNSKVQQQEATTDKAGKSTVKQHSRHLVG
jgi:hypothetical protein